MARKNQHRFLVRVDSINGMHGWYAKLSKPGSTQTVAAKFFSDKPAGDKKAFEKALSWRNKMAKKHKINLTPRTDSHMRDSRSKTAVVGVLYIRDKVINPSKVSCLAQAMINGVNVRRSWSVRKWGYLGSWRKAVECRRQLTGLTSFPLKPPPPPQWLKDWANQHHIDLSR